jgi:hypothetical protein
MYFKSIKIYLEGAVVVGGFVVVVVVVVALKI